MRTVHSISFAYLSKLYEYVNRLLEKIVSNAKFEIKCNPKFVT